LHWSPVEPILTTTVTATGCIVIVMTQPNSIRFKASFIFFSEQCCCCY
jgi:hypothetical protein